MSWYYLVIAGLLEICWAIGLKYSNGFTRLLPSFLTLLVIAASLGFLGLALRQLPVGTAYAVWTGIGTVGTVIAGIILLGEPAAVARLLFVSLILIGIVGLKVTAQ